MKNTAKLILAGLIVLPAFAAHADTRAVIDTNVGKIELLLDEKKAPKTVANFVQYAQKGFYNGTIFHRVIDGFMVQGGGFTADMTQKATDKAIANEADNGLKNTVGTIAMARTANPNSATSQFFINVADNDFLNFKSKTIQGYGYAVFGKVISGMDVVNKIAKVQTTDQAYHQNIPVKPIVIQKVSIVK
ncbi:MULTISPECIES: peptidylprolyl isomerase [Neisseria]|uniref:Peptidyl-prolyl cis-trans isomerase n=1 Tax=Neisseria dumasiana TaxID=1931275 RepID=A0A1X3DHX2_9NEIS|nr:MULTISPECIES: peptidylprolyl isomerase [Neisseria]KPN73092.1 peptidylprolyl isomerase [Neisseria sp. 74A18]OSI14712.1 peptidylprolyl isomerase [Neisseria dumasiana]OSI20820.1 peptidylprolyl isomerase [Neisseria dumasiana]OSI32826.1 peptidylprolyl isomerase [Neisseria dumasiana]UOO83407.1 peptidyl-prolyl cis-trans isomerase [Neisseria dumasiana]